MDRDNKELESLINGELDKHDVMTKILTYQDENYTEYSVRNCFNTKYMTLQEIEVTKNMLQYCMDREPKEPRAVVTKYAHLFNGHNFKHEVLQCLRKVVRTFYLLYLGCAKENACESTILFSKAHVITFTTYAITRLMSRFRWRALELYLVIHGMSHGWHDMEIDMQLHRSQTEESKWHPVKIPSGPMVNNNERLGGSGSETLTSSIWGVYCYISHLIQQPPHEATQQAKMHNFCPWDGFEDFFWNYKISPSDDLFHYVLHKYLEISTFTLRLEDLRL